MVAAVEHHRREDAMAEMGHTVVTVGAKRTLEYAFEALADLTVSKLNPERFIF